MTNIYTGDYQVLKNEINYLLDRIYNYNDKYDNLNLYSICELLIYEYWSYNDDGIDYYRRLNRCKSFISQQRNRIKQLNSKSLNDFISKKGVHLDFSEHFLNNISEIEYSDLSYYLPNRVCLDENDAYAIFKDFLGKYHPSYMDLFNYLIDTKKIFYKEVLYDDMSDSYDTSGINIFNSYSNDYYIFIKSQPSTIIELASLAHEFGHTMDYTNLLKTNSKKDYSYYTFRSPFLETISSLVEIEFFDFCLDNHLETKYVKDNLQKFYLNIIYHMSELNLICNLPDVILKSDKYKNLSKEKLYKIAQNNCELAVDINDFCEPSELNYSYNIEYGYGRILATYFSYLRKNNSSKYLESFNEFLKLRNGYFPVDLYKKLGTTTEEISKIVREEINSKDVKIYMK